MADILLGNVKGPQGNTGATGSQGPRGDAATITVGTVSTTAYGNTASVTNSGTEQDAVLDFVIPQGKPGEQTTRMGALTLDTITAQSADFPIPAVGETGSTVFGKIIKFFNSTISALNNKLNISDVVNNLTSTSTTQPLSAAQGKALNDALGGQWVVLPSGSNFNSLTSNARYYVGDLSANGNYPTGIGSTGSVEIQKMGSYIRQVVYTNLGEAYRFSYDNGASWYEWADTWVILATGTNLNTLVNNAKYMVGNMAAMVNGPSGKGSTGTLEIQRVRASYVRQIAYLNSGASYRFSYDNGGTWTGWA